MRTFMGYRRPNGSIGTRNFVVAVPTVNSANDAAYRMCMEVPGTFPLLSDLDSTFSPSDKLKAERVMNGILRNPNVYAAVIVGTADCDPCSAEQLAAAAADAGKPVLPLSIRDYSDFDEMMIKGINFLKSRYYDTHYMKREEAPLSELTLVTKSGGSGSISALSNNAAVGRAVDMLINEGGSAIFCETAELLGIEKVIASRCATAESAKKLIGFVNRLKNDIEHFDIDIVGRSFVHDNIESGLSTLEEKSAAFAAMSGSGTIIGVSEFAEPLKYGKGLYFMDTSTREETVYCAGAAAGANLGVYSFPGGESSSSTSMLAGISGLRILPTVKVLGSGERTKDAKYGDVYTGDILTGAESVDEAGENLFERLIRTASGEKTYTEKHTRYYGPLKYFRNGLIF